MQIHANFKGKVSCSGWHHTMGQSLYELSRKYHFTLSLDSTLCKWGWMFHREYYVLWYHLHSGIIFWSAGSNRHGSTYAGTHWVCVHGGMARLSRSGWSCRECRSIPSIKYRVEYFRWLTPVCHRYMLRVRIRWLESASLRRVANMFRRLVVCQRKKKFVEIRLQF